MLKFEKNGFQMRFIIILPDLIVVGVQDITIIIEAKYLIDVVG